MAEKPNALERIAQELSEESDHIDYEAILVALTGLMNHLRRRAADAIVTDQDSPEALVAAREYWVYASLVDHFGGSLIAYDDIEEAELVSGPLN